MPNNHNRGKVDVDRSTLPMGGLWTEPLARGLRVDSPEAGEAQRNILQTKQSLRMVYRHTYQAMLGAADQYVTATGGCRIELGSGGGFFGEVDPSVFTSDVRILLGLDAVFDARWMPFADGSVDVIFAMHVVHHIAQPRLFLAELQRVLKPGGALVAVEPFWSPVARLLYTYAHPEAFDRSAETWEFESSGAMSSNQAMSYLFLERDLSIFTSEFPDLEIIRLPPFGGPSYVLTGGIWKRKMLPDAWLAKLWGAEHRSQWWRPLSALHHLFLLRRSSP